jgi:hypothetical protein
MVPEMELDINYVFGFLHLKIFFIHILQKNMMKLIKIFLVKIM